MNFSIFNIVITVVMVAIAMTVLGGFAFSPVDMISRLLKVRLRLVHGSRLVVLDAGSVRYRRRRMLGLGRIEIVRGHLSGIAAPHHDHPRSPEAAMTLRQMLARSGWHLMIVLGEDMCDDEVIWLVGLGGPVGTRMLLRGQATATTLAGRPFVLIAWMLRRGLWGRRKPISHDRISHMNHHRTTL